MSSLRTPTGEQRYKQHIKNGGLVTCPLCRIPATKEYTHWKLVPNEFPYDLVAAQHDMLVPKRHVTEQEFTEEERREFVEIKESDLVQNTYNYIMEATRKAKSIPPHFHLHLVALKNPMVLPAV